MCNAEMSQVMMMDVDFFFFHFPFCISYGAR